jgi:7-carboxy-7-deazaguanine synthase
MSKQYLVNEIHYTIHGEGVNTGLPHVFVRFSKCNCRCSFCDTEFESGLAYTAKELVQAIHTKSQVRNIPDDIKVEGALVNKFYDALNYNRILLCGGEPLLQVDDELVKAFKQWGFHISIETNGTLPCPEGIDWITCSPKIAEHALKLKFANELKYVRDDTQGIPKPSIEAANYIISPMFDGDTVRPEVMEHCVQLVKDNPGWRLGCQNHKFWGVR